MVLKCRPRPGCRLGS
ncbi:hypothetical protein MTR67_013909 [Solanum verrucosum]|uniref:Uncharacterized protein n=1 Tax=Solanum verrucosum TaxID=315347 RepID=A0AAF0QIG7_SOLVR|nr:hypothetical protein MTR67_013909 [Solanum verrucosum]